MKIYKTSKICFGFDLEFRGSLFILPSVGSILVQLVSKYDRNIGKTMIIAKVSFIISNEAMAFGMYSWIH